LKVQKAKADADQAARAQAQAQKAEKVRQLVARARAQMAKDPDAAEQTLAEAEQLAPKDPAVLKAQDDLRQARQAANQRRKQAEYDDAIKAGREALAAQRYDDAIRHFTEAGQVLPGDARAAQLLRQARQAKTDSLALKDGLEKRQEELARLLAIGQAAMQAQRFEEAIRAYTEATRLDPQDADAARLLREANQAAQAGQPKPPADKPRPPVGPPKPPANPTKPPAGPVKPLVGGPNSPTVPEYLKQMQAGAAFEQQLNFAEAVRSYRAALRIVPNDPRATLALQAAELKMYLLEGRKALLANRFAEAERAYQEVLKRAPGNQEAILGLQQARQGKR
jgi:tetratricopeptide (TPR) repeat protein